MVLRERMEEDYWNRHHSSYQWTTRIQEWVKISLPPITPAVIKSDNWNKGKTEQLLVCGESGNTVLEQRHLRISYNLWQYLNEQKIDKQARGTRGSTRSNAACANAVWISMNNGSPFSNTWHNGTYNRNELHGNLVSWHHKRGITARHRKQRERPSIVASTYWYLNKINGSPFLRASMIDSPLRQDKKVSIACLHIFICK